MKAILRVIIILSISITSFAQDLNKEIIAIELTPANMHGSSTCSTTNGLLVNHGQHCQYTSIPKVIPIEVLESYFSFSAGIASAMGLSDIRLRVRFSKDTINWSDWVDIISDDHGNSDGVNFTSKQYFFDKAFKFFQFNLEIENLSHPNILLKQLELRFLSASIDYFSTTTGTLQNQDDNYGQRLLCSCPKPTITSRTAWGCPDGQNFSGSGSPSYTTVTHLIVHHEGCGPSTTEAACNTPPPGGWAQRVYSTWDYHTSPPPTGNGWDDIGYNYLVDQNGIIYEGRGGGENVIGAHFCGSNGGTMGTCVLGRYNNTSYPAATQTSLKELLAWKACDANIDPLATNFHSSSSQNLKTISGHKDHNNCTSTDCPGTTAYNFLPTLRTNVNNFINNGCNPPNCTDTYEPNNSYQTAYNVTGSNPLYNTSRTINLQSKVFSANDYDWYLIGMDGPGKLTIDMTSLPEDYYMEIYNMNGLSPSNYIDGSDNPGTADEQIIYCQNFLISTFIYLTVYTNGGYDECDSYDIQLSWIPGTSACQTTCSPPTNLTESSITTTSATVSWSSASGAQDYEVQYLSGGSWTSSQSVAGTSKSLTGLTCSENYQWRVRTVCAGSTYSSWVTNSFSTSNCGPVPCPAPNDDCNSAQTITVNGSCKNGDVCSATQSLAPGTNCNAVGTPVSNYARDVWYTFTASQTGSYTITVNPGDSLDAVLDVRTAACGGTSIDCADSGGGRGGTETLTIPSLNAGTYYIRIYHYTVAGLFAGSQTDFQLCVTGPSPINCDDPTNLATSNPTQDEIDLDWDDVVPSGTYEIEYRELGASNWQTDNSSNSSQTLQNLQCGTTYEWKLRTDCGGGDYSSWVSGQTFTTATCCPNVALNNVTGSNAVCIGVTETYSVNLDPTYTYTWVLASGGTIAAGQNTETVQVNWTSAGQHIIEVTADNGCDNETEDLSVLVEAIGAPTVQIPSPLQACANDPLTITAMYTLGGTAPTFNWYINGNLEVGNTSSQTFTNIAAGDIVTVEMTSSSSCATPAMATSNSATVQIINAQPVSISISTPSTQVCSGSNVVLTATSSTAGGAPTYDWLVNGSSQGNGSSYALSNVTNNTSVVCVLTSSLGCVTGNPATSNNINISVNNPVTPSIIIAVPNDTICSSDAVTATATLLNGGGAPTLTWAINGSSVGACQNQTTCPLSNLTNGDVVTCSLTSSDTCVTVASATSNSIAFTVKQAPNLVASASANAVCPGDTLLLFASGANNYSWTGTNGFNSITANTIDYPTVTTSYTVLAETNGCDTSNTFTVDMKFVPRTNAVPSDTTICLGNNALLQLESATLNWYQWGPAGTGLSSTSGNTNTSTYTNSNIATPDTTTQYLIYVGYQNGCHSNDSILVTVVDTPNVPLLDTVGGLTVLNPPSGNATYYWYLDGQPVDTSTVPYLLSGPGGNYQVIVHENNICYSSFSNTVGFVGITPLDNSETSIIAYPNPNNGRFVVQFSGLINSGQVVVLNVLGQNIRQYKLNNGNQTLEMDLSTHPAGIYLLHYSSLGVQKVIKIVKK